jgi:hypothetical protein
VRNKKAAGIQRLFCFDQQGLIKLFWAKAFAAFAFTAITAWFWLITKIDFSAATVITTRFITKVALFRKAARAAIIIATWFVKTAWTTVTKITATTTWATLIQANFQWAIAHANFLQLAQYIARQTFR